jgi:hypothetical protein
MDSAQHWLGQAAECLRLMKLTQSKDPRPRNAGIRGVRPHSCPYEGVSGCVVVKMPVTEGGFHVQFRKG